MEFSTGPAGNPIKSIGSDGRFQRHVSLAKRIAYRPWVEARHVQETSASHVCSPPTSRPSGTISREWQHPPHCGHQAASNFACAARRNLVHIAISKKQMLDVTLDTATASRKAPASNA